MISALSASLQSWRRHAAVLLGCFACAMLALHFVNLHADPIWKFGFLTGHNWPGDLFTDEGWEANAATRAVQVGDWHIPGEVNLAVESPLWPLILYLPFKIFGINIAISRGIAAVLYMVAVGAAFLFVKRLSNSVDAALTAAILSVNVLAFTFGRVGMLEPALTSFVVLAILVALYAADRASIWLSIVTGLLLSCAVLFKLTALFGAVPILMIFWMRSKDVKTRVQLNIASGAAFILVWFLHYFFLIAHYPLEHKIYLQRNLSERSVHGVVQWLMTIAKILIGLHYVGPFLIAAFVIGLVAVTGYENNRFSDPLLRFGIVWLAANLAILSTLTYFPPRYCFSLLFPITILTVRFAGILASNYARLSMSLYIILAAALVSNCAKDLYSLAHPQYTMLNLAKEVRRSVPAGAQTCAVAGSISNTLSLYNEFQSENYMPGWVTEPQWKLIKSCDPKLLVTRGVADPILLDAFNKAGKSVSLNEQIYAMRGDAGNDPFFIYTVRNQ